MLKKNNGEVSEAISARFSLMEILEWIFKAIPGRTYEGNFDSLVDGTSQWMIYYGIPEITSEATLGETLKFRSVFWKNSWMEDIPEDSQDKFLVVSL